jgi:hypothetical protein
LLHRCTKVNVIEEFAVYFSFIARTDLHKSALKPTVTYCVMQNVLQEMLSSSEMLKFVLDMFVRTRLYFMIKYLNDKELNEKKRKSADSV